MIDRRTPTIADVIKSGIRKLTATEGMRDEPRFTLDGSARLISPHDDHRSNRGTHHAEEAGGWGAVDSAGVIPRIFRPQSQ
jgi:hypothetical protein